MCQQLKHADASIRQRYFAPSGVRSDKKEFCYSFLEDQLHHPLTIKVSLLIRKIVEDVLVSPLNLYLKRHGNYVEQQCLVLKTLEQQYEIRITSSSEVFLERQLTTRDNRPILELFAFRRVKDSVILMQDQRTQAFFSFSLLI